MELEELHKQYGMPILYKAFLITENHSPEFLDPVVQDQSPKPLTVASLKTASKKNNPSLTVLTEGSRLAPSFPNLDRYTTKSLDPSFKSLIDSIYGKVH